MTGSKKHLAHKIAFGMVGLVTAAVASPAMAERVGYSMYGTAGIVDMPTAYMNKDGVLATTISNFAGTTRSTLTYQITPRISGSFRYSTVEGLVIRGFSSPTYYDRSFDISYKLLTETRYRPAVKIGLQDFIGTGLYGGEYIVATKEILPGLRVTGGLGWGRLGSYDPIGKTGNRPRGFLGKGGVPSYNKWFKGNFAPFGGVAWDVTDRMTLKAEYSSDQYRLEQRDGLFKHRTPLNFGVDYKFKSGVQLSGYALHGDTVGALLSVELDPRSNVGNGGLETAPLPVAVRASQAKSQLGWVGNSVQTARSKETLKQLLALNSLELEGLAIEPHRAVIRLVNPRYGATPQAIGRAARAMSRALPASVETFVIVPVENGLTLAAVTIQRSDLERLEHASAQEIYQKVVIQDGHNMAPPVEAGAYPKFKWSLGPFLSYSMFDPDQPLRYRGGARLRASYQFAPGLEVSGSVAQTLVGDMDKISRRAPSNLPRVRTDSHLYQRNGDLSLERLTVAANWQPAKNLYGRVTLGYLEQMYAGASAELLWKPADSRLAFGAELNVVQPRAFDGGFDLRSSSTPSGDIPKLNGHVSAYYDMRNGFHGQLDVGRYLAGDYGATIAVDREFVNGWRVGAWATFTDVSSSDFGEGSFDKGIRFTIPMSWGTGRPSRSRPTIEVQSLTKDGGAKLRVPGRLYDKVRAYHRPIMSDQWGKFWR